MSGNLIQRAAATSANTLLGGATLSSATNTLSQAIKVIDISERPAVANVIRDGKQVPAVTTSALNLQNWLNIGVIRPIEDRRRIVSQTVPPGTRVARGTTVDILLADPGIIPINVLDRSHQSLIDRNFTVQNVVDNFLVNPAIRNAVLDAGTADQIPPATQTLIRNAFNAQDMPINDGDPVRDFGAAFRTLKAVAAFG
jgi:hypothetical protein